MAWGGLRVGAHLVHQCLRADGAVNRLGSRLDCAMLDVDLTTVPAQHLSSILPTKLFVLSFTLCQELATRNAADVRQG